MLNGKHILVGISGGIAAYKIPDLIRLLIKNGADVRVTTSRNAFHFVTELTLQTLTNHPVYSDVFGAINEHSTEHISLPEWADMMIVAPASADVICKMANGVADDALTTTFCTIAGSGKPIVIAPAMNSNMLANPTVQEALTLLDRWHNVSVLDCGVGQLACGVEGKGRMQDINALLESVYQSLTPKTLTNKHILITAGGTIEKIDPVRYISNFSTGKMGASIARECVRRGARVTLICPQSTAQLLEQVDYFNGENKGVLSFIFVESAAEMCDAAISTFPDIDIAILSAAVADFTPCSQAEQKIKKAEGQTSLTLSLVATTDIAASLGKQKTEQQRLIGFALETENEEQNAIRKLRQKGLDAIVLNSLRDSGAGFATDTNKVTIYTAVSEKVVLPLMSKDEVATKILDLCL